MKLQGLAVLFAIILLPIVIVTSSYIQTQIDTVVLEQRYDAVLMNATHDAIKAFQLNEINSNTENIVSEKMRDIEASISTFYNSLGTGMGSSGYSEGELKVYVPALVYNLYDGYYIYAPYDNINTSETNKEWGLKPFIYYSARYKHGSIDVTINYTLDNYITVYGWVDDPRDKDGDGSPDGWSYVTEAGYLINPDDFDETNNTYKGIPIQKGEQLREVNEIQAQKGDTTPVSYQYIDGNNGRREKVYLDGDGTWYKYTVDKQKMALTADELNAVNAAGGTTNSDAITYYKKEAKEFSKWVEKTLGSLTIGDVQFDSSVTEFTSGEFFKNGSSEKIFDLNKDPESNTSNFYNHKRDVIRNSIESNLASVIASYNKSRGSAYNFKMPELTEQDWDKITNHVNMIAFMQGLPIKNKYYMGYTVVSNNMNREFVDPDSIYILDTGTSSTYHSIFHGFSATGSLIGYRNLEFEPKSFVQGDEIKYYLPHGEQGDYDCIVSSNAGVDDKEEILTDSSYTNIATAYYTALARERYNSYKSTKNFLAMLTDNP